MQIQLWTAVIILLIAAGILSARLCYYKKQIAHIRKELELLENTDTNYQITSAVSIGKTEEMISAFNRILQKERGEKRKVLRENTVYRESITSISHDIRTPLTSAKGYLQMLQNKDTAVEKKEKYITIVEQRLDYVTDMLNQLFEYARIEAGEMEFEPEEFNAVNLFAETIALFYDDFLKKGCEPEISLPDEPCRIFADRHAFVRITENLVKNALVHGTRNYRFALEKKEDYMVIYASNQTDTIERSDIDKIFDRFYTTDKSRSRKTTGLGLAIVKRFTEQIGGSVRAYLEKNQFIIELKIPLRDVQSGNP